MECGDRGKRVPLPPDHADGNIYGSRVDPDCGNYILGPDGHCGHGWFIGCDGSHPDLSAGAVCRLVSCQGAFCNGENGHTQPYCYRRSMNLALSRSTVVPAATWPILRLGPLRLWQPPGPACDCCRQAGASCGPPPSPGSRWASSVSPWSPVLTSHGARSIPDSRCTQASWSTLWASPPVRHETCSPH